MGLALLHCPPPGSESDRFMAARSHSPKEGDGCQPELRAAGVDQPLPD